MVALFKWARNLTRRAPSLPLLFPSSGFEIVSTVYASKYHVLGKLGFGTTSTVWLARNLLEHKHVALKVYTRDGGDREEFEAYGNLSKANPSHPGYRHVRAALDTFVLKHRGGDHHCLVQKPMWDSWRDLLRCNPNNRFTEPLLKAGLKHVFLALDCLHTECKLVHTDIKADNILQDIVDESILDAFTNEEMESPSPRKIVNGTPIYASRRFQLPADFGGVVLSDFDSSVRGDRKRNHDAQPNVYRSPEVMLKVEWSYPVDIWSVGAMIWDLFEGKHLFYGDDPDGKGYSTRAHLAEVVGTLGPPPLDLLQCGVRSKEFFTEDGQWKAEAPIPQATSLGESEEYLEGENKKAFLAFVGSMLQWRPEDRKEAKQLLRDPWLNS
ncbi:CMGC protein kinase [Biscogniauxia marginata]|nr:CMGC protein kinase [Biscogniauxia marginata]